MFVRAEGSEEGMREHGQMVSGTAAGEQQR